MHSPLETRADGARVRLVVSAAEDTIVFHRNVRMIMTCRVPHITKVRVNDVHVGVMNLIVKMLHLQL